MFLNFWMTTGCICSHQMSTIIEVSWYSIWFSLKDSYSQNWERRNNEKLRQTKESRAFWVVNIPWPQRRCCISYRQCYCCRSFMIYANEKSHLDEEKTKDRTVQCWYRFWTLGVSFTGNTEDQWLRQSHRAGLHLGAFTRDVSQRHKSLRSDLYHAVLSQVLSALPCALVESRRSLFFKDYSQRGTLTTKTPLKKHIIQSFI